MTERRTFILYAFLIGLCFLVFASILSLQIYLTPTLAARLVTKAKRLARLDSPDAARKSRLLARRAMGLAIYLQKNNSEQSAGELVKLLDFPDDVVQASAMQHLYMFRTEEVRSAVLKKLKTRNMFLLLGTVTNLGLMQEKRAAPELVKMLHGQPGDIRAAAAIALGRIGYKEATPELLSMLSITDPGIQSSVVKALSDMNDTRAIGPLKKIITSAKAGFVRDFAKAALYRLGDETFETELIAMMGPRPDKYLTALWAAKVFVQRNRIDGAERLLEYLLHEEHFMVSYLLFRDTFPDMPRVVFRSDNRFPGEALKIAKWLKMNTFNGQLKLPEPVRKKTPSG